MQGKKNKWGLFKKTKSSSHSKLKTKAHRESFLPVREEAMFRVYPAKKIIFLGSKSCGKTSLAYKYVEQLLRYDPYLTNQNSVVATLSNADVDAAKKSALDVKMAIRDLRSTEIIKALKRYLTYAHTQIQALRTKQIELVQSWEDAKLTNIQTSNIEASTPQKSPKKESSLYISQLKQQIGDITVQITELESGYRQLKPLYRVLLHGENEHKRLQHLITTPAEKHQIYIEKHTHKLQCELKLLNERQEALQRLEKQFDEAVKQRKADKATLEQDWIGKRNDKLDLELLINEEKKKLQRLRDQFKKSVNMLKTVVPTNDPRKKITKGKHVRQSTRFDNMEMQELKDLRAMLGKNQIPTSNSTDDLSESSEEFDGHQSGALIGGFVQNRLSPATLRAPTKRLHPIKFDTSKKKKYLPTPPVLHLVNAVKQFNEKPQAGIKSLVAYQIIEDTPQAIAVFLARCASLSRAEVGEYLGQKNNTAVAQAYAEYHILKLYVNVPFHIAFRSFIATFQLPKEGQMINRIVEAFVDIYVTKQSFDSEIKDADTALLMGCALLTLNAEIHSGREVRLTKTAFCDMFMTEGVSNDYVMEVYEYCVRNKWAPSLDLDDKSDFPAGGTSTLSTQNTPLKAPGTVTPGTHLSPITDDRSTSDRKRHRFIHHQRSKSRSMDGSVFYQAPLYFAVTDFSKTSTFTFKLRDMMPVSAVPEYDDSETFVLEFSQGHIHHMANSDFFIVTYAINDAHSYFIAKLIIQYLIREGQNEESETPTSDVNSTSTELPTSGSMSDLGSEIVSDLTDTSAEEFNTMQDRILLVGCKADQEEQRCVSYEEASSFALHYHVPYFEVSAHYNYNIDQLYKTIFQYCVVPPSQQIKHTKFDAYEVDTRGMSLTDVLNMTTLYID